MLLDIANQLPDLLAPVIARAFVVHFPKHPLNRVRLRAIGRQEQQLKARMQSQPLLHRSRLMNAEVVYHHTQTRISSRWISLIKRFEQPQKQPGGLALTDARDDAPRQLIKRPGQVALLIHPRRDDLDDLAPWHPLIADLRQQMDVQLIS